MYTYNAVSGEVSHSTEQVMQYKFIMICIIQIDSGLLA
jgi:hypothetical protein